MRIVSLIPARGGSKGIPKKNILNINGKPLIYYSINNSLNSLSEETWVSTDDEEIKQIALSCGAQVIDRPKNISSDSSTSEEALLQFSQEIDFDILVFLQNTSPLTSPEFINRGIEMVSSGKYDSAFSAYKEHWCARWNSKVQPINWDPNNRPRRQDIDDIYVENGAFYVVRRDTLISESLRYGGKIGIVEMPFSQSIQIDTYDDAHLISRILKE